MSYIVLLDVSGDITGFKYEKDELGFIPMEYSLNEEMIDISEMKSREELKPFYQAQREGQLTRTSQIAPYNYYGYFEEYLKEGKSILYISLSSGLSGTYTSANLAKDDVLEKFEGLEIEVVDSKAASGGMGILAERAIKNLRSGMSLKENANEIRELSGKLNHWFLVQNLDYLKRGGRISAAKAAVGNLLNIHPILEITKEGKLENFVNKRGKKLAIKAIVECFKENYVATGDPVYVVDSDDEELSKLIEKELVEIDPSLDIRKVILSPVIGSHTGPNLGAIIHVGK